MASSIPFDQQYFVEIERNRKYQWFTFLFSVLIFIAHGLFFFWLPRYLRYKRDIKSMAFKPFFMFLDHWENLNRMFCFRIPFTKKKFYFTPSLLIVFAVFLAVNGVFTIIETADIDYLPQYDVISKRISRVAMGNMPAVYILVTKNDFVTGLIGLTHERVVFFHFWFSRLIYIMIIVHVVLGMIYWQKTSDIMLRIPPQIFGWIGFGCFTMLIFANLKFIRDIAFDFFMVTHRIYSFIFLLMVFFHNRAANTAMVVLAVHLLVLDRIVQRVFGIVHRLKSPTKGMSEFEILDEDTFKVTMPMKMSNMDTNTWYSLLIPKYGTWKAGSHVLLNVGKISLFQYHPFTILSLPETGKMVLIIKKKNGFTKKLYNRIVKIRDEQLEEERKKKESGEHDSGSSSSIISSVSSPTESDPMSGSKNPNIVKMKAGINGPFFPKLQPLVTFDSVAFFAIGVGASFVFPICLDLLQYIESKELANDYIGRPSRPIITIYWSIRNVANMSWYSDFIHKLSKYINSRKLSMEVYITRESEHQVPPSIDTDKTKKDSIKIMTSNDSSDISSECPLMEKFYGSRMDIGKLVKCQASKLNFPEEKSYRSMAVLDYEFDALEPYISGEIMSIHYLKHNQAYVDGYNTAMKSLAEAKAKDDTKEIVTLQQSIKFNGGGYINHALFWKSLSPVADGGGDKPTEESALGRLITQQYGSVEELIEITTQRLTGIQGSGWAWIVKDTSNGGKLDVVTTSNQDIVLPPLVPLIGIDAWEHAYYLQYQNVKLDYFKAIWNVINWKEAESRFDSV
ncbi:putative superoxide dismutase Mn mitochondrial [Spathaspora sp. JA1]|nr:putative superoxide dismutase Mn mitochondrial [Spathaspora sp. JA1]